MSRLDEAKERLDRAVSRLEAVSMKRFDAASTAQRELAQRLAETKKQCVQLQNEARDVASRLDQTIARVQDLLSR